VAQASVAIEIPAPPDPMHQLIGGFGSLPDWLPYRSQRSVKSAFAPKLVVFSKG
jgi:hypothetical protein